MSSFVHNGNPHRNVHKFFAPDAMWENTLQVYYASKWNREREREKESQTGAQA